MCKSLASSMRAPRLGPLRSVLLGERLSDHVELLDPQLPAQQAESTAVAAVASSLAPAPASLDALSAGLGLAYAVDAAA